jgi:hypothetical protein
LTDVFTIVDDVAIATIGQGEVADTPCVSLCVVDDHEVLQVATEQVSEARFVSEFPMPGNLLPTPFLNV